MTPEEVDKIEELIRAIILQERPDFPSGWRAHNERVAAAKDALAKPSETVDTVMPSGAIETDGTVTQEMMRAGRAIFNKTHPTADVQIREVYRAMHAARPKREVTDEQIAGFLYEFGRGDGALDIEGTRAALQAFADGRGL